MPVDAAALHLTPIAAASRTELVATSIRQAILSGGLGPGETLVERRLSEQFQVSKTPVREALIGLAHTGLIVARNKGFAVRELTPEDLRHVFEVRMLLEPWAAEETVRHDPVPAVSQARDALADAGQLMSSNRLNELSQANRRIHRALYAGCRNDLVVAQLDGLSDLTSLGVVTLLWSRSSSWREEFVEHAEMIDAAEAGDAQTTHDLTREHIRRSVEKLGQMLDTGSASVDATA